MFEVQFGVDHELRKVCFKRMDLSWRRMFFPCVCFKRMDLSWRRKFFPCRTQALNFVPNLGIEPKRVSLILHFHFWNE